MDTSNKIYFTKMHALGNDFLIINGLEKQPYLDPILIANLANRHTGVGFDQLLMIKPSDQADFHCQIFNADGHPASQCGNGLRCIARYLHEAALIQKPACTIATESGVYDIEITNYDKITLNMGRPKLIDKLFPFNLDNITIPTTVLDLGNPHAIININTITTLVPEQIYAALNQHPQFTNGVNVGFMSVLNRRKIALRTFERGVGETHACGSNACAAVVAGIANGWLENNVEIVLRYGTLSVEWQPDQDRVLLTGPATHVYTGFLKLNTESAASEMNRKEILF